MNPRTSGRTAHIAAAVARRHGIATLTCRGCRRPVGRDHADAIWRHFANMGVSDATIEKSLPLCTACSRLVIDLAFELKEGVV